MASRYNQAHHLWHVRIGLKGHRTSMVPDIADRQGKAPLTCGFESFANNVQLELSVWDLKFIFGELHQYAGKEVIEQHISIRIPWLQAKILSLFLQINLAFHETVNGKLTIPPYLLPQFPLPGPDITDPQARELAELFHKKLEQFLADA